MKTVVYFVRHAEPDYNNHDDRTRELSPKGIRDRSLVTAFLQDKNVDIVLSSPYKRAIDTIRDFADNHGFDIEIVEDFRERKVEDVWIDDFKSFCKAQWADFSYKLSTGESFEKIRTLMPWVVKFVFEGDRCIRIEQYNLFYNQL